MLNTGGWTQESGVVSIAGVKYFAACYQELESTVLVGHTGSCAPRGLNSSCVERCVRVATALVADIDAIVLVWDFAGPQTAAREATRYPAEQLLSCAHP